MPANFANDERSGFRQWLDRRSGLDSLLHHALDEPIPGGARIAYVFGSGLLFLFLSQVITGVFLAMYYVPSADHAHTTVAYITKEVTGGSFLRSIHAYGSSAIIIVLLLHLTQTFLYGSYKGRRELVWLAGCVLLALMLGMAVYGLSVAVGPESLFSPPRWGPTFLARFHGWEMRSRNSCVAAPRWGRSRSPGFSCYTCS